MALSFKPTYMSVDVRKKYIFSMSVCVMKLYATFQNILTKQKASELLCYSMTYVDNMLMYDVGVQ